MKEKLRRELSEILCRNLNTYLFYCTNSTLFQKMKTKNSFVFVGAVVIVVRSLQHIMDIKLFFCQNSNLILSAHKLKDEESFFETLLRMHADFIVLREENGV